MPITGEHTAAGRESILVIDHDPAVRAFLEEALGRADFDVTLAADGEGAIVAGTGADLRAIVLDTDASPISGPDLLAFLRCRWPAVPVIVTTRWSSAGARDAAHRWGATAYVSDLNDVVALAVRLRDVARSHRHGAAPAARARRVERPG